MHLVLSFSGFFTMVAHGDLTSPSPSSVLAKLATAAAATSADLFPHRKRREFIPENRKDETYWDRR